MEAVGTHVEEAMPKPCKLVRPSRTIQQPISDKQLPVSPYPNRKFQATCQRTRSARGKLALVPIPAQPDAPLDATPGYSRKH